MRNINRCGLAILLAINAIPAIVEASMSPVLRISYFVMLFVGEAMLSFPSEEDEK